MKVQKEAVVYACFASVASRVDEYRVQSSIYPPIRQWGGGKYKVLPLSIYQHLGNNREAGEAMQP